MITATSVNATGQEILAQQLERRRMTLWDLQNPTFDFQIQRNQKGIGKRSMLNVQLALPELKR